MSGGGGGELGRRAARRAMEPSLLLLLLPPCPQRGWLGCMAAPGMRHEGCRPPLGTPLDPLQQLQRRAGPQAAAAGPIPPNSLPRQARLHPDATAV